MTARELARQIAAQQRQTHPAHAARCETCGALATVIWAAIGEVRTVVMGFCDLHDDGDPEATARI